MTTDDKGSYIHEDILFEIIGDHPHTGERCHPVGTTTHSISMLMGQYQMYLINCQHGLEGCFVKKENLKLLEAPKPKVKIEVKSFKGYSPTKRGKHG